MDLTTGVDSPHAAVMWTVGEVADRDGVSKQAISKRALRFANEQGLVTDRDVRGRIARLHVVQFDELCTKFGNPAARQAPAGRAEQRPVVPDSREEAMRQRAWIAAERSRLQLDEAKGDLISSDVIAERIAAAGSEIVDMIDRRPNMADDIAAAVARDGANGARALLTEDSQRLRSEIAAVLRKAAGPDKTGN